MSEQRSEKKRVAFGRPMPKYRPCSKSSDGKHSFERLKHNQFEKCRRCGEPRFALRIEQ